MDQSVKAGITKSCGCLLIKEAKKRIPELAKLNMTHGMSQTREYHGWEGMIQRCTNPNDASYPDYGGRGIKVCGRWLESFENFYADTGKKSIGLSIDRINNNGNYEPGNWQWATSSWQRKNQRRK